MMFSFSFFCVGRISFASRATYIQRILMAASLVFFLSSIAVSSVAAATPNQDGSIAGLHAKFIDVQGVKSRYYEMGEGEPLVLVHGEGWSGHSSANTWSKNLPGQPSP